MPQVGELLVAVAGDRDVTMEVAAFAALALGLVFVGRCHAASAEAILQVCNSHTCLVAWWG